MRRRATLAALVVLLGTSGDHSAHAEDAPVVTFDAGATLAAANAAAAVGDWVTVERALATIAANGVELPPADRAEVLRLAGLVAYFGGRVQAAEIAWVAYLRLDWNGHLDPQTTPPEAVAFLENVRARHPELRPPPPRIPPRQWALNLVPVAGQLQHHAPVKAAIVGGSIALLLAANLTTYGLLRSWCDERDGTCEDHDGAARTLRVVNGLTGVGAIVAYVAGVVDAFATSSRAARVEVRPVEQGALVGLAGSF